MSGASVKIASPTEPVVHSHRRLWVSIVSALITVVVLFWASASWRARVASAQIRSLAVLSFADLTPQHDDWFAPALTAEIVDRLAGAQDLQLIGHASALKLKSLPAPQPAAAATIEGTVSRTGDRLRIALTMTRASDGYRLWSAHFDRPARDLAGAIEDIAAAIARRVQVRMAPLPAHRGQPSAEAYPEYLQGRYLFDRAVPGDLDGAQQHLQQATAADPNFVAAWAWLSIVREYRVAAGMARPNQAMPASRDAAERAVALDPQSGWAQLALGIVNLQYDWDWAGARQEFDRAAQSLPGSALVHQWSGRWYQSQGRMNEALAETERALALDPLSPSISSDAAAQYVSLNQPDRAIPFAQKAVDFDPADPAARARLANVYWLAGQKDQARQMVDALRTSGGAAKLPPAQWASLEARLGDPDDARQLLDAAEDLPDDQLLPAVEYARLAAVLEDWDRVFSWTEEAFGERDLDLPYWPGSPLAPKSDPRFDAFLAQMNLPSTETR
ncbi:MAG TPA: tetratricopeptide repeat protein [Bryobacteraceae bacterium]|jgi:TolB-like protein/Tfp pilus assembly protein PilF|nr:tetratricopeptide repeat protein [Bryobacteraceae bacterium]